MLYDFSEPVCRACCNYEGIDRIAEVIDKAKHLRRSFDNQQPGSNNHSQSNPEAISSNHVGSGSRSPHDIVPPQPPAVSVPNLVSIPGGPPPVVPGPPRQMHVAAHSPTGYVNVMPGRQLNGSGKVVVTTNGPKFHFPALHMSQAAVTMASNLAQTPTLAPAARLAFPMHKPPQMDAIHPQQETTQRFAQIQETLNVLSKSPPFRVRFSKDHSLIGRVIAFDAVCRGSDYELKVFIEYPIGSGTIFQSASGAGRQMYGEFRERLGIGGGFRGASSNGYKDLEFEKTFNSDDWRVLGELLTEEVRFFRGPVKKDLLPQPYVDPQHPNVPSPNMNSTRGFLKNNLINRKRRSSNEDESDLKKSKSDSGSGAEDNQLGSPRNESPSPRSSDSMGQPSPLPLPSQTNGVTSSSSNPSSPQEKKPSDVMECMLCNKPLDDTRFVQCPSSIVHRFCFPCSRESIKTQMANSKDVYCPSSMRCLVQGSVTPWAFMEQEITTILKSDS